MSAFMGETYVEDALPQNETLAEHDKKKHPDGFDPETDSCKFREGITTETETDKADEVSSDKDGQANASKTTTKPKKGGISHIFTGSAANYDKPSLLKVGTGEGAQVFGWGLYGSTERGVAENYAKSQYEPGVEINGRRITDVPGIGFAAHTLEYYGNDISKSLAELDDSIRGLSPKSGLAKDLISARKLIADNSHNIKSSINKPTVYEQTFFTDRAPGDESHLLKWYEPVTEEQIGWIAQSFRKKGHGVVKYGTGKWNIIDRFTGDKTMLHYESGEKLYEGLASYLGSPKAASEFLARAGIDGVKYPVDSFGGKGVKNGDEVGWNYVSFRDDNIRIDKKYVDGQKMYDYQELMAKHHSNIDPMEVLSYLTKLDTPEEMAAEFARIMESGKIEKDKTVHDELVEVLVMDAETLKDQTLQEHDRIHHKEGYHEGDTCKFRDKMKQMTPEDKADEVYVEGKSGKTEETVENKPLVTPEEDSAYMEAVEKGDMETASKMVREIAARAFPNTKVSDSDGLPKIMFHGTEWDGKGAFLPGRVYFATEQGVEEFIDGAEGMNSLPLFVNITNPFYAQEGMTREDGSSYKGYGGREDVTGDDVTWGEDVQGDLERRGYDGIIDTFEGDAIDDDAFFNCVFNSRNIKSADPVTYDDNGNVIPLSRRFDDGDDIRGEVSGKSEYVEKMKSMHPDINPEELIGKLKGLGSREEMEAEIKKILGKK